MGQDIGKQCGACGLCAPEDPSLEQRSQLETPAAGSHGYPRATAETSEALVRGDRPPAAGKDAAPSSSPQPSQPATGAAAPSAPAVPSAAPKAAAPAAPAPAGHASGPSSTAGKTTLDLEVILADLYGAEQAAYSNAFKSLAAGQTQLQPDHAGLRDFILTNTAITVADLDTELLKIASNNDSFSIDRDGFIQLLQEHPLSESDMVEQFMNMSSNGDTMTAEDCRTGLLHLMQQKLHANFTDDKSERIFDTAMVSAGLTVTMEQWFAYCKTVARIVRLARYAKV